MSYMTRKFFLFIISIMAALGAVSCIEDGVSTSPADQPAFSVDTLDLGTVFSGQPTPTYKFMVYNRHNKVMSISDIRLRGEAAKTFRINVDGTAGYSFNNIEIRPNDSIFVFVEATMARGGGRDITKATDFIDFITNGVKSSVVVTATGRDIDELRGVTLESDTRWTADVPHQIFDSLVVAPGVTLTIDKGTELFFHDKASLQVRGRLIIEGSHDAPVVMTGDRTDNIVGDLPYDLLASQWGGIQFHPTSSGSRLTHAVIKNTTGGVLADSVPPTPDGQPGLTLVNCRLRNSAAYSFMSWFSDVTAVGCEFAEAALSPFTAVGGNLTVTNCTMANYYLFSAPQLSIVTLDHYSEDTRSADSAEPLMRATFANCIIYGLGNDFNAGDLEGTDVWVKRCLLKSEGSDDNRFIGCLWGADPLYNVIRDEYIFDYTLQPGSPAIGVADASLTPEWWTADLTGVAVAGNLGAYQQVKSAE